MKKYHVSEVHSDEKYTAGVVNQHVEFYLNDWGYKALNFRFTKDRVFIIKLFRIIQVIYWYFIIPKKSLVVFHVPVIPKAIRLLLKLLNNKGVFTIALIHDIDGLRFDDKKQLEDEKKIISSFKHVIVHNTSMRDFIGNFYPTERASLLWLFDYKSNPAGFLSRKLENSITIAANVDKSYYLNKLDEWLPHNTDFTLNIYGKMPHHLYSNYKNFKGHGVIHPDELPNCIEGSFGMIWDGYELEDCTGSIGNYLRYNSPHKLSLYLSAGMPVIIWRDSAMAKWIVNNAVGITVGSWGEATEKIRAMLPSQYMTMHRNAIEIGKKLRSGFFFKTVLENIESTCIHPTAA